MIGLKRWIAAVIAVLFLATTAFHAFGHADQAESSCVVCHVQGASLPASVAPKVAAVPVAFSGVDFDALRRLASIGPCACDARAPPVDRA